MQTEEGGTLCASSQSLTPGNKMMAGDCQFDTVSSARDTYDRAMGIGVSKEPE
jgi:hypothetical protein